MGEEFRKRVLIVDDEPWVHDVVGAHLKSRGYEVASAMDGAEAIASVYAAMPALLILDFNMPGMQGGEVFEKLRSKALLADLPVIFLSSLPYGDQVQSVPISRNVRFARKPVDAPALLALVAELVGP